MPIYEEVRTFMMSNQGFWLLLLTAVGAWAYRKNNADHNSLGEKVDRTRDELAEMISELGDKIDEVRFAISEHEAIWHAPNAPKPKKKASKKQKNK